MVNARENCVFTLKGFHQNQSLTCSEKKKTKPAPFYSLALSIPSGPGTVTVPSVCRREGSQREVKWMPRKLWVESVCFLLLLQYNLDDIQRDKCRVSREIYFIKWMVYFTSTNSNSLLQRTIDNLLYSPLLQLSPEIIIIIMAYI